jgi:nicotinamidase-related amidase
MLFPPVPTFPLRDGHAALLVLDCQSFMTDRRFGLGRSAAERGIDRELDEYFEQVGYGLRNAAELVQAFRAAQLPIVFTRLVAPVSGGSAVSGLSVRVGTAYGGLVPTADSPEAQIVSMLAPQPGNDAETVLERSALSPFVGTPLDAILREHDTRYLVLAGVMTGWSVELAAREAADLGYGVQVVSDACPGETYAIHDFIMDQLVGGLIRVRPTGAVLEMLAGRRT